MAVNETVGHALSAIAKLDWGRLLSGTIILAILGYFVNEWVKRRDLRLAHISDEKRKVYGQIYGSLTRAADNLFLLYEFHKLVSTTGTTAIRDRIYKVIALSKLSALPVPDDAVLTAIEQANDHAAIDRLCWRYLNALLDRSHALGQRFSGMIPEAEFLMRNRGILRGAQRVHAWIMEQGKNVHKIKTDKEMDALLEAGGKKIEPVRVGLVEDYDLDYTLRRFRRKDDWDET